MKIETIQPAVCLPRRNRHFSTKIEPDREDSIRYELHDDADRPRECQSVQCTTQKEKGERGMMGNMG